MKCPLKFSRYEFEGGEECIGAECGFYGSVCTDATNGIDGETNGIRDEITLPDGDAVSILRRAADSDTPMVSLCDRFDAAPLLPSEHSRVFGRLADMVERDYARRDAVNAEIAKLIAERDEWKAKAEQAQESYFDAKSDRDAWHARYVTLQNGVHSKPQSKTELTLSEQSESLSDGADSREKLEADRYEAMADILRQLDKVDDEGIVYLSKWALWSVCSLLHDYEDGKLMRDVDCDTHVLLETEEKDERIAELTEQLEAAHAKNRALKAHISKMQSGRHGWHVKGVELQRQVDELTAQLHSSNAERARLRECLGIATDNAHDFLTLVDESGNVYDRDEGLA